MLNPIAPIIVFFNRIIRDSSQQKHNGHDVSHDNEETIKRMQKRWIFFGLLIGTALCIYIQIRWNTVPCNDDHITIKCEYGDTVKASWSIKLVNDYFCFGDMGRNGQQSSVTLNAPTHFYIASDSSLRERKQSLQSTISEVCGDSVSLDSLSFIYSMDIRRNINTYVNTPFTFVIRHPENLSNTERISRNTYIQCIDSAGVIAESSHGLLSCFSKYRKKKHLNYESESSKWFIEQNTQNLFNIKFSPKYSFAGPRWLAMEDISQMYYTIQLDVPQQKDSIDLTIDFVGATEFLDIQPEPDERSLSSIRYTDQNKIRKIADNGRLKVYCKFPEMENVQELRLFLLTTILAVFIAQIFVYLYTLMEMRLKQKAFGVAKLWIIVIIFVVIVALLWEYIPLG